MKRIIYADPLALEVFLTLMALMVGCAWALPGATFNQPLYALVRAVAPEDVWAAVMLALAALKAASVAMNQVRLRRAATLFASAIWMFLALACLVAFPIGAVGWMLFACALASGWLAWRVR